MKGYLIFFICYVSDKHIGVSPSALRTLRKKIEKTILSYQQVQQKLIQESSQEVSLCLAADEKFFNQVVLVMLDLPSGYIFVEKLAENRQYTTWIDNSLKCQELPTDKINWVKQQLLPAVYWQQQVKKTKTPTLKRTYQIASLAGYGSF